jgi:acyl carrier protein
MTSLDALALIADLEEEFRIEIPNEQALTLRDVRQAVACVRSLLPETSGPEAGQS